jgi:hypothetical protein
MPQQHRVFTQHEIPELQPFFVSSGQLPTTDAFANKQQQFHIYKSLYLTGLRTVHRIARPQIPHSTNAKRRVLLNTC